MTNKTPIPWPSLSAEEKRSAFWKSMGVEPIEKYWCLQHATGKFGRWKVRSDAQIYLDEKGGLAVPVEVEVYPPITLDELFALAKRKGVYAQLHAQRTGFFAVCHIRQDSTDEKEVYDDSAIDALAIALLRHAGFEVLTEGKV